MGLLLLALLVGCGGSKPEGDVSLPANTGGHALGEANPVLEGELEPSLPPTDREEAPGESGPLPIPRWEGVGAEIAEAFDGLEGRRGELVLFRPRELPAGTRLAPHWIPVSDAAPTGGDDLEETDDGPSVPHANPLVSGAGPRPEIRVLLEVGEARVEILEGVQGDLGDLPMAKVTLASGREGGLYRVFGGHLIQWSFAGSWYAVFGRGLAPEDLVRLARGMEVSL